MKKEEEVGLLLSGSAKAHTARLLPLAPGTGCNSRFRSNSRQKYRSWGRCPGTGDGDAVACQPC